MGSSRQIEEGDRQPVWSNYTIKTFHTDKGETVIGLPHLSRCQIATSEKGESAREFLIEQLASSGWTPG